MYIWKKTQYPIPYSQKGYQKILFLLTSCQNTDLQSHHHDHEVDDDDYEGDHDNTWHSYSRLLYGVAFLVIMMVNIFQIKLF